MKNTERQKSLDKKKWDASIEMQEDMSGKMFYCELCGQKEKNACKITHEQRVKENTCAKAYNKFTRWVK